MTFNPEKYKACATEKEALRKIIDEEWFPWQQEEAMDWFQKNRGWFKEAS